MIIFYYIFRLCKIINCIFVTRFYKIYNLFYLKKHKVTIGKNPIMLDQIIMKITNESKVKIGDNFRFLSGLRFIDISPAILGSITVKPNAVLSIGDNVGISSSSLLSFNNITIGNNVLIGAGSLIMDTNGHSMDPFERKLESMTGVGRSGIPVVIEDDVWIGSNCSILGGAHVCRGAVIAINSVIKSKIPPYAIAIGNPAKVVGFVLTPEEIVENEKLYYPENQRLPLDLLEKNYYKYYLNCSKEIRTFSSSICK